MPLPSHTLGPQIRIGNSNTIVSLPGKSVAAVGNDGKLNDQHYQYLYTVGTLLNNVNPGNGYAPINSPVLTGVPQAPTAANGTNTTQIATTAFVANNALSLAAFASPPALGSTTPAAVSATTLTSSNTYTPSTTYGIVGTTLGDSANGGSIGEFLYTVTTLTPVTSGVFLNVATLSLSAGDWDVYGLIQTNPAATTTQSALSCGISPTSLTYGTYATGFANAANLYSIPANSPVNLQAPPTRVNVSATTNIYLVAAVAFAVSTLTINGVLTARRRR